mmetsp:Transcript_40505/g.65830  ORF Transcript_40505/g.65830 Transcript_40505/m.65830 type:complete len:290 (+) Transcript_40505:2072-2941(+)
MTPPKLSGYAPRADVLQEVVPRLNVGFGENLQLSLLHSLDGASGHVLAIYPPLGANYWLNDVARSRAKSKGHWINILADVKPLLLQGLNDFCTNDKPFLPLVLSCVRIHSPIVVEDVNKWKLMAHPALEVVGVVSWRDLHGPRTEGGVYEHIVGDDLHLTICNEGVLDFLTHQVLVPLVGGMYCDCYVSQHRFYTRCSNFDGDGRVLLHEILEFVNDAKLDELVVLGHRQHRGFIDVLLIDFNIREGRLQRAAPIHEPSLPVDQPLLVHSAEGLFNSLIELFVHGEGLP